MSELDFEKERSHSVPGDWIPIDGVMEVIQKMRENKWLWPFNSRCKYITLRLDMRDGHCVMRDRRGNIISLADLNRQANQNDG